VPKQAVARGDLSQKVEVKVQGADLIELKEDINGMVEKLTTFANEVTRVSLDVGTKGKLGGQAVVQGVEGTWQELTAVVNKLAENLTTQVRVSQSPLDSFLSRNRLIPYSDLVYCSSYESCSQGRSQQEDRDRGGRRDCRAEDYDQCHGGSATELCC
jgi:hypothetical protein